MTKSGRLWMVVFLLPTAIGWAALSGCAVYQHRIIEPAEFAGPVPKEEISFRIEPLEYRAVEHGTRLVLRIANTTSQPITLLGERSYLVDAAGETRAVGGGTIAPHSFITLVLPPVVDRVRTGPRFGVGVGVGTGFRHGAGYFGTGMVHDPWRHHPTYVRETIPVWRWTTGLIRLHLAYEREDYPFHHEFVFDRVRIR